MSRLAPLVVWFLMCFSSSFAYAQDEPAGILRVVSGVPGSVVHIDYEQAGEAPLVSYVSPGQHTVRVSADGHEPYVRRVDVYANQTTEISAQLRPGKGSVEFFIRPMGAVIELDGQPRGPAPIRLNDVTEGTHTYRVSAPRHEAVEGTFDFALGKNVLLYHELESSAGRFSITSNPEGASVWLDGRPVGETPVNMRDVAPGVHVVRLEAAGYATVIQEVDTSDGEKGVVQAKLDDKGAKVVLKTGHAEGIARVQGQVLGKGKKVKVELGKGRYDLSLSSPDDEVTGVLKVPDGGWIGWRADYEDDELVEIPPFYRRWTFWTAVGVGAGGATAAAVILTREPEPEPLPSGDIVVTLP